MWLDKKYIMLLGGQLDKFSQKSDDVWTFRCPLCNDSQKSKNRTRGYIYFRDGKYRFHCHNCDKNHFFSTFLRIVNVSLYDAYLMESIADTNQTSEVIAAAKVRHDLPKIPYDKLKKISQLNPFHEVKRYLVKRQIPTPWHAKLYYCPAFKTFTNSILPGKFDSTQYDEARVIIPIRNIEGQDIGYQGRAIGDSELKYITIMLTDDYPRLFNSDECDFNRRYYCFEGPIDAMFIKNSMAACGSNLLTELEKLNRVKHNAVVVLDNEPRNKQIVNIYSKVVKAGYKVCIWPEGLREKDVNEMILKKVSGEYVKTELVDQASKIIQKLIDDHVCRGLDAELKLAAWKKV